MYVTRTLSHYKSSPEALNFPSEGPNSGYLVIADEEPEAYSCFGLCKISRFNLEKLPFPQNKILTINYSAANDDDFDSFQKVVFIPLLNQPLSSIRYYAIQPRGSHKGEAFACSRDEDMVQCCCGNSISDVKPRPFNPQDIYQEFEIIPCADGFNAKALAEDGYPPDFLRGNWKIHFEAPKNYELLEAKGINDALRSRLPDLNFTHSTITSNHVVGKWYCPFVFVKEGSLADQVKNSIFYEMTLEQKWEQVFEQDIELDNEGNIVSVKASFRSEAVFIGESQREAIWDERNMVDGVIWFSCLGLNNEKEESVGLNLEIVERMKWEEEIFGWVGGGEERRG